MLDEIRESGDGPISLLKLISIFKIHAPSPDIAYTMLPLEKKGRAEESDCDKGMLK